MPRPPGESLLERIYARSSKASRSTAIVRSIAGFMVRVTINCLWWHIESGNKILLPFVIYFTNVKHKVLDLVQTMQICLLIVLIGVSALRLPAASIDVVFNDNRFGALDET